MKSIGLRLGDYKSGIFRKCVLGIELVIILLFVCGIVFQNSNQKCIEVDFSGFQSAPLGLKAGSYTLVMDYESDEQVNCQLFSDTEGMFLHANTFALSRNKKHVAYNFYTTRNLSDICISITDYENGNFILSGARIYSDSRNLRLMLLVLSVFFAISDAVLFSSFWANAKERVLLLLGVALLASVPCFIEGINTGHDIFFHLGRIEGLAQGLKRGDFPVRMNTFFMDGYGYPTEIFYGGALLYIPAVFRLIGFSVVSSYKLYVFVINLITAVSSYVCGKGVFKSEKTAVIVSAAYTVSSYRMVDIWTRSAVGEFTALAFLPIIALAIWNIYTQNVADKNYNRNSLILAGGMLGLLLSHILSTEMAVFVIAVIFVAFIKKSIRKETLLVYVKAIIIFLLVGASFIVSFVDYYMHVDLKIKEQGTHFIQSEGAYISDYFAFFKNVLGNSGDVLSDRMQFSPGAVLITGLLIATFLLISGKMSRKGKVFLEGALVTLFLSSNVFPWNQFAASSSLGNMLSAIQFPWRYLGVANIFLALLLGEIVEYFIAQGVNASKLYYVVGTGTFLAACLFISSFSEGVSQQRYIDAAELHQYPGGEYSTTNGGEYKISGTNVDKIDDVIHVSDGEAALLMEDGLNMRLNASMNANGYVLLPRFNYPNYIATDKFGNKLAITNGDNNRIMIVFPEIYEGEVQVEYKNPWYWMVADVVSLITASCLVLYCAMFIIKKKN